ncbi:MAG: hypothetical protein EOO51_07885 [Flavobacterium sp.]|nr:MAG: hypothetical protein EOO51_07885 [Flavobacterium sp.]
MHEAVYIRSASGKFPCKVKTAESKIIFDTSEFGHEPFDIEIHLKSEITSFRNHDYTWADLTSAQVFCEFSPKVVRLKNGNYVQPNVLCGIWQVNPDHPKILLWRFNVEDSHPLTVYLGKTNDKVIAQAAIRPLPVNPALLFSDEAVEFSRSKIPFSAVACFTDHCDYDTGESLALQRKLFHEHSIKVTKGFFLNDYSKRGNNASFEKNREELNLWRHEGHELAYHSLSQSIKPDEQPISDFKNFIPPYPDLNVWIDHGYQPYNLSLYRNSAIEDSEYGSRLEQLGIHIMWNYIDSGTASEGVINQMNTSDFTLRRYAAGIRNFRFSKRMALLLKNIIFHYYASEKLITSYKKTVGGLKAIVFKKQLGKIPRFVADSVQLSWPVLKVMLFWKKHRDQPYRLAKYAPLLFRHRIGNRDLFIFQTIEMVDFKKGLSVANIEKLIHESGIFIAHTYFAVPMKYHSGRMFKTADQLDPEVAANFTNLGDRIRRKEIWNPTLGELATFLSKFDAVLLDVVNGKIVVVESGEIPFRTIK